MYLSRIYDTVLIVLLIFLTIIASLNEDDLCLSAIEVDASDVRPCCERLANDSAKLLFYLNNVEQQFGSLSFEKELPSLYMFKAVAVFEQRKSLEAIDILRQAVQHNPNDLRAWLNLGEILSMTGQVQLANDAYDQATLLSGKASLGNSFKRIQWHNIEYHINEEEKLFLKCLELKTTNVCEDAPFTSNIEFINLNGTSKLQIEKYFTKDILTKNMTITNISTNQIKKSRYKLTIGFIVAYIDGGPVNSLMQSMIKNMNRNHTKLVVFLLTTENTIKYHWIIEFLSYFDDIISLHGLSDLNSAETIATYNLDILIDTNGYNYQTGVHILQYKPCKIQVNYLGDPITSALEFIDYYIGDIYANPVDITTSHFSEKLVLLDACYIANSHMEWLPDILFRPRQPKHMLSLLSPFDLKPKKLPYITLYNYHNGTSSNRDSSTDNNYRDSSTTTSVISNNHNSNIQIDTTVVVEEEETLHQKQLQVLLGVFHTYNKFDPIIFHVWMNILRRSPVTALVFNSYPMNPNAMQNILIQASYYGHNIKKIHFLELKSWFSHIYHKSSLDLYLDTYRKNGHTTTIDALWAGIPSIVLGGQYLSSKRSAESILNYGGENIYGIVYSLKEYEDLVIKLTSTRLGRRRLQAWRKYTEQTRFSNYQQQSQQYSPQQEQSHQLRKQEQQSQSFSKTSLFNPQYFATSFMRSMQTMVEAVSIQESKVPERFTQTCSSCNSSSTTSNSNIHTKYHIFIPNN